MEIPHETASDFFPVYSGQQIYFLSGRAGHIGIFRLRSGHEGGDGGSAQRRPRYPQSRRGRQHLVFDQLGEIHLFDTVSGKAQRVPIEIEATCRKCDQHQNVATEIDHATISPTGLRAALEAHGEILTVPAKPGPTRNITNTPGVMERWPAVSGWPVHSLFLR